MKKSTFVVFILITLILAVRCSGGDGRGVERGLYVEDIVGLGLIEEGVSIEYAICASGDTGLVYQWSVNPSDAGEFDDVNLAVVNFVAAKVTSDTAIEMVVTVSSDEYGPIVLVRTITVCEFRGKRLLGIWTFKLHEGDPGVVWSVGPLQVTISQLGGTVHIALPSSLIELVGSPGGFYLNENGSEARSVKSIYGGTTGPPLYISFSRELYLFQTTGMHLGVSTGVCDDLEGLEYRHCIENHYLQHWYAASYSVYSHGFDD